MNKKIDSKSLFRIKNKSGKSNIFKGTEKYDWVINKNINNKKWRKDKTYNNLESLKKLKDTNLFNYELEEGKCSSFGNIDMESIEELFSLINLNSKENKNKISKKELWDFIKIIQPNFPKDEISSIILDKEEISTKDVYELLNNNNLKGFNLNLELFNILKKDNEDEIDELKIYEMIKKINIFDVNNTEISWIKNCLDLDEDGTISKSDFLNLMSK